MRWMKKALIVCVPAALLACADTGEEMEVGEGFDSEVQPVQEIGEGTTTAFGDWDADRDARLANNEFGGWFDERGVYRGWNTDQAEGLTEEEFGAGVFGLWDEDNDNRLTEAEWNEDAQTWFGDQDYGSWSDWDADRDGYLTSDEFNTGLGSRGLYGTWDRDTSGMLENDEFNEGWFGLFDTNDDTYLDTNEWTAGSSEWGIT